jgi:uncharacterized protein (DUF433 family)
MSQDIIEGEIRRASPMISHQSALLDNIRAKAAQCCQSHLLISIDEHVLGGIPHIAGTRLSVGQVLGRLYVLGSVEDVALYYRGSITPDQIKEALAYAQDFIESVCEPSENNG